MKSSTKIWERVTASATLVLAFATVWLAVETRNLARDWRKTSEQQVKTWLQTSSNQIGVQTWLTLAARFDSKEMALARKTLATQLDSNNNDKISEEVLDLFEDIGTLYDRGLLDKQLAISSFSYSAPRWWEAAQPYVIKERRRHGADSTLFQEFENFARAMRQSEEKINDDELKRFLTEEKNAETRQGDTGRRYSLVCPWSIIFRGGSRPPVEMAKVGESAVGLGGSGFRRISGLGGGEGAKSWQRQLFFTISDN